MTLNPFRQWKVGLGCTSFLHVTILPGERGWAATVKCVKSPWAGGQSCAHHCLREQHMLNQYIQAQAGIYRPYEEHTCTGEEVSALYPVPSSEAPAGTASWVPFQKYCMHLPAPHLPHNSLVFCKLRFPLDTSRRGS